mmetsp:Transcript_65/g.132  ORF Transcript_65/g.132 Transcript_65/m.132 type:complete len:228 (+) Transcript_65:1903-2586(+)
MILKDEYKSIRQREKADQKHAYKVTVRQLESMIRLSEAMARAHCEHIIRPEYVREVCRLLRNSNVYIQKNDIEIENIQDEINNVRHAQRQQEQQEMMAELAKTGNQGLAQPQAQKPASNKVKITFDEYQRLSRLIFQVMKDFEVEGQENVQQAEIINKMVQKLELESSEAATSIERSIETSKKVQHVISYLIAKENALMVSQDSKVKNERYLCMNINVDLQNMNLGR